MANKKLTEKQNRRGFEQPSRALLKSWGEKITSGEAKIVPVFVGGSWNFQIPRNGRRVISMNV